MPHINLLPWRQTQRAERQRQFVVVAVGAGIMMALVVAFVHIEFSAQIESQERRNDFLKKTIATVEKEIAEIRTLKEDKKALLARMDIIQQLQHSRPEIVHLFEEIARNIPKGVYLKSLARNGDSLNISGIANSNDYVSAFMRRLDSSEWLTNPKLDIIQSDKKSGSRARTFKLQVKQTIPNKPGESS